MSVTTTSLRQGKFETRFWHKVLEEEVGRVKGHFGPINTFVQSSISWHNFIVSLALGSRYTQKARATLLVEKMVSFEFTTLMIHTTRQNPTETWRSWIESVCLVIMVYLYAPQCLQPDHRATNLRLAIQVSNYCLATE